MCLIDGCSTEIVARGMCMRHYRRWSRNGNTKTTCLTRDEDPYEYFISKIDKTGDCWEWKGGKDADGYGIAPKYFKGKYNEIRAHRISYMIHNGELPKWEGYNSLCIMHKCDNPSCVNPDHLTTGTHQDNMRDRDKKGRQLHGDRHHSARFKEKDVLSIRERLSNGERPMDLAREKGVTFSSIVMIRDRLTWKHI